jgi:ribosomal protein S18 acetylase RimI-like enzyme
MANRFAGYIDTVEPALAGWVVDRARPNEPARFAVTFDRDLRFEIVANLPRPDVGAAGLGGPNCGFQLDLPIDLLDGAMHEIDFVLDDGQKLELSAWHSPLVLGPLSPEIVPLTTVDHADIRNLLRLTNIESGVEPDAVTGEYVADWMGLAMNAPGGLLFGARVAGRLVGYAMLEPERQSQSQVGAVALSVLTPYRRKGIGERLLGALLDAASEAARIGEIWLAVEPGNLPARRLYEKLGFVVRATRPQGMIMPETYLAMLWRPDGRPRL